ncbi:hypothetical protein Tco_1113502 [Tanacetum coccineum]|uniref:Uncharacterized protein n=1 Tax=Tanacetum coccineum TaxID=301880 RepID=A0ABQ5IW42_9ASTR
MCTRPTSLPKILDFIMIGAKELLPLVTKGNVISLPSEMKYSDTLSHVWDSPYLIMSIGGKAALILQLLQYGFLIGDNHWFHARDICGSGSI